MRLGRQPPRSTQLRASQLQLTCTKYEIPRSDGPEQGLLPVRSGGSLCMHLYVCRRTWQESWGSKINTHLRFHLPSATFRAYQGIRFYPGVQRR